MTLMMHADVRSHSQLYMYYCKAHLNIWNLCYINALLLPFINRKGGELLELEEQLYFDVPSNVPCPCTHRGESISLELISVHERN